MNDCQDETCVLLCAGETSRQAYAQFGDLLECARRNCNNGRFGCMRERCTDLYRSCYGEGESDCTTINSCTNNCVDAKCRQSCVSDGTWEAQGQYAGITDCIIDRCSQFQNDFAAMDQCRNTQCRDAYTACMPPDNCNLLGGDCPPSEACIVETWGSTYCQRTEGVAIGQECFAGKISCADGSLCRFLNGSTLCQENCFDDDDCTNQGAYCEPYVGTPIEYGACINPENCVDTDGDLACDDSDCAPNDPQARPGYAEKCGDEIDNNCDGQINEGCEAVCEPVEEVCGNEMDDDCDTAIDEGCAATSEPTGGVPAAQPGALPMAEPGPNDLTNPGGGESTFYDPANGFVDASADGEDAEGCACDASDGSSPVSALFIVGCLGLLRIRRQRR